MRRLWLGLLILAFILVPFALWGDEINGAVEAWLATDPATPLAAPAVILLLAADIVLPVPSSIVATASGTLLGFAAGTLVNWIGLMAGSALGYWLGMRTGRRLAARWLSEEDMEGMQRAYSRYGEWLVVLFRAVPVLAEASAFFAGINAFPMRRYVLMAGTANLGLALLYAAIGHWALHGAGVVYPFLAALVLPGIALLLVSRRGAS